MPPKTTVKKVVKKPLTGKKMKGGEEVPSFLVQTTVTSVKNILNDLKSDINPLSQHRDSSIFRMITSNIDYLLEELKVDRLQLYFTKLEDIVTTIANTEDKSVLKEDYDSLLKIHDSLVNIKNILPKNNAVSPQVVKYIKNSLPKSRFTFPSADDIIEPSTPTKFEGGKKKSSKKIKKTNK
jgi:hypothetical protein